MYECITLQMYPLLEA